MKLLNRAHSLLKSTSESGKSRKLLVRQQQRCMNGFDYGSCNLPLLKLNLSSYQQPLHDEDSFFIYDNSFGVADGVGGWNNVTGGNPKEFSRRIMDNCVSELHSIVNNPNGDGNAYLNAKDLLVRASIPVMEDKSLLGGSTALIGMLINKNILSISNVGDSRFYLFRKFVDRTVPILYFISPEQIYSFNAPIQLSPAQYLETNNLAIDPNLWSEYYELPITVGDIILFVTDGVSDNLFPYEISEIVMDGYKQNAHKNTKELSSYLSESIVKAAVHKQQDTAVDTPFGDTPFESIVKAAVDTPFGVAKPDDTTCIVGVCTDEM